MKLTFNQMEVLAEQDLIWFFNHAQADMGIKSNWQAMVQASCFGGSTGFQDHHNSFILNSVGHYREVEKVYKAIPREYQEILYATFADVPINAHVQRIFKKHSGAAYCSIVEPEDLEKICEKISKSSANSSDKLAISKVRIDCLKKYNEAITEFVKTKYYFKRMEK